MIRFRWMMAALLVAGLSGISAAADPVTPPLCCSDDVVCVRVPEIKKVPKRVYTDVCEPLCLPRCSILGHLLGHNDCCDGGGCGGCRLWKKKTLVGEIRAGAGPCGQWV